MASQVRKRHVFYCSGYDARGERGYHSLFREALAKSAALWNVAATTGAPMRAPAGVSAIWPVLARGPNWTTETVYEFLRWDDIVRADLKRPLWHLLPLSAFIFLETIWTGVLSRWFRAAHPFALFYCYAFLLSLLFLMAGVAVGIAVDRLVAGWPGPFAGILAAFATYAILMRWPGHPWFVRLLLSDWALIRNVALGRAPALEARFEMAAARIVEIAKTTDADELILVGHSSGCFHVLDIAGRALARDPQLPDRVPLNVLTVGASVQLAACYPGATALRKRIAAVARHPSVYWAEFQSRQDLMNFFRTDPVVDCGIAAPGELKNPRIRRFHFNTVLKPETLARIRHHPFRLHFQFVLAPEQKTPFDYPMIAAGPLFFRERIDEPQRALEALGPSGEVRV
jgi:hypothetical protein